MRWTHVALLLGYAVGMSAGQVLFKLAAQSLGSPAAGSVSSQLPRLAGNPYFLAAIGMYLGLSVAWVYLLSFIPLSRAYPFVAAAFIFTPVLGATLFGEKMDPGLFWGLLLIAAGLFLVARR